MQLGILYKDGKIINHRSFIKVVFNPIFRYFGFCIATKTNDKNKSKLGGIKFIKCKKSNIRWNFKHDNFDSIIKKRIII